MVARRRTSRHRLPLPPPPKEDSRLAMTLVGFRSVPCCCPVARAYMQYAGATANKSNPPLAFTTKESCRIQVQGSSGVHSANNFVILPECDLLPLGPADRCPSS